MLGEPVLLSNYVPLRCGPLVCVTARTVFLSFVYIEECLQPGCGPHSVSKGQLRALPAVLTGSSVLLAGLRRHHQSPGQNTDCWSKTCPGESCRRPAEGSWVGSGAERNGDRD